MRIDKRTPDLMNLEAIPPIELNSALVVIVDPDAEERDRLTAELGLDDHEILELHDGPALVDYIEVASHTIGAMPDVIVASVSDPDAGVLEACEHLHDLGAKIPIVLLASARGKDFYVDCDRAGVTFIIDSPIDLERVRAAVRGLTENP